jgi:hypothetical protein
MLLTWVPARAKRATARAAHSIRTDLPGFNDTLGPRSRRRSLATAGAVVTDIDVEREFALPGRDPPTEQAAAAEGFRRIELMSTVSGRRCCRSRI